VAAGWRAFCGGLRGRVQLRAAAQRPPKWPNKEFNTWSPSLSVVAVQNLGEFWPHGGLRGRRVVGHGREAFRRRTAAWEAAEVAGT